MTAQPDLFGAGPPPPKRAMAVQPQPARPAAPDAPSVPVKAPSPAKAASRWPALGFYPAPPTAAWANRLAEAGPAGQHVRFLVSWLWTGEVIEQLCDADRGRALLRKDGKITEIKADIGQSGRIIFLDPARAAALHAEAPLIRYGVAGTHSATYRFANPDEATGADLELPPGCANG